MLTDNQLAQLDLFNACQILNITPLNNGLSHRLYHVTYTDPHKTSHDCVLRYLQHSIHGSTSDSSAFDNSTTNNDIKINYGTNEYKVMQLMYELEIGPSTIDFFDVTTQVGQPCSLIVMDFVIGDLASNMTLNDFNINQLSNHLLTLHCLHLTCPNLSSLTLPSSPNSLALLDEYWAVFPDKKTADINRFEKIKNALKNIEFKNDCLIHGDLNFSNILINAEKMTWIDWEYASIGDSYFDYATLCVESIVDVNITCTNFESKLIKALELNSSSLMTIDRERLTLFKLYYASACWLWLPKVNVDLYVNQRCHYQLIADKLLADILLISS